MDRPLSCSLDVPVLLVLFNRPKTTARVFDAIRQARPRQLFIAADGPRPHVPADVDNCRAAREIVAAVDWDCDVKTLLRKRNLGCRMAVSSAITWFFQHVEAGIILEDDILPAPAFFLFCRELLHRYRHEPRVMMVSANNFQMGLQRGKASYYFSRMCHIWGWATWRRAWDRFAPERATLVRLRRHKFFEEVFPLASDRAYWRRCFEDTLNGIINSWDHMWTMSVWNAGGVSIVPNVNLASNIGFCEDATHTTCHSKLENLSVGSIFELINPCSIVIDVDADAFEQRYIYSGRCEDPDALALAVVEVINAGQPDDGAILARQFLMLHPENQTLEWLYLMALYRTGQLQLHMSELAHFIKKYPRHPGAGKLLAAIAFESDGC